MMSANIDALNDYLSGVKAALAADDTFHFIVGNEAADLDSMASALLYAYLAGEVHAGEDGHLFLPLINIPRADFCLRTEAVYLFKSAGVQVGNLIFSDDVDLETLSAKDRLRLILVDHNKLTASLNLMEGLVDEIIDHHEDKGLYPEVKDRIIEPVGSAATLVADKILQHRAELIDEGTAKLLLGTILLDTVNLDPEAKRVTPKDEEVAVELLALTGIDQKQLFDKLQFEKFNVSSLGTYDLLRKDYKEWQMGSIKCGIGSVLMPLEAWIKNDPEIVSGFDSYLKERSLNILLAMNAYTDPDFHRDLVVYSPDRSLRERVVSLLTKKELGLAGIEPGDLEGKENISLFSQGDLSKSRKKLQPILQEYLSRPLLNCGNGRRESR